jgi:1-acyl-sn-glycerol-3-phosphate acyltransferase
VLLRRLDQLWRLAMTGIAFAAIGIGGCGLAMTIIPAATFFSRDKLARMRRAQAIIRASFRLYVWMLQILGVIRLEVVGADKLAACRGHVIIANHPTLLDVVLIMSLVPRAQCVVKHQLWRNPFIKPVLDATGYIRNDHPADVLVAKCRERLLAGNNLIVFPEGTRSVPGQPLRFRRGFAHIATLSSVNIQPITIECNPITLVKGERWYVIPACRPCFRVEIGEAIETDSYLVLQSRAIGARLVVARLESYYSGRVCHG